jgi:hypothetical protein
MSLVEGPRVVPLLLAILLVPAAGSAQTPAGPLDRAGIVAALETLMISGEPRHTDHDLGQRLQEAVAAAIAGGDRDLERLAVRAAAPLIVTVTRPVSPVSDLPFLSIDSFDTLRLPRPVAYRARVFASLDGAPEALVATVESGSGGRVTRVPVLFGERAAVPGVHTLRLRADLTFAKAWGQAGWTETRLLPSAFYALYLPDDEATAGLRSLVTGPAETRGSAFDSALGDEPVGTWLRRILDTHGAADRDGPDWRSEECTERTAEAGTRTPVRSICAVGAFLAVGRIGEVWFRTAEVREGPGGAEWVTLSPPRFDGLVLGEASVETERLSNLPWLLDTPAESRPIGDVSVLPQDITVSPAADDRPGRFEVIVDVRNTGSGDLLKTRVSIAWVTALTARGASRSFVVDIPAHGSVRLSTGIDLPAGYGLVMVDGMQLSEHMPAGQWVPDPTPEDSCAVRIVNPAVAPDGYLAEIKRLAEGCNVR